MPTETKRTGRTECQNVWYPRFCQALTPMLPKHEDEKRPQKEGAWRRDRDEEEGSEPDTETGTETETDGEEPGRPGTN